MDSFLGPLARGRRWIALAVVVGVLTAATLAEVLVGVGVPRETATGLPVRLVGFTLGAVLTVTLSRRA